MDELKKVKSFLNNLREEDISFDQHFYRDVVTERPITERLIRSFLKKIDRLEVVERQKALKEDEEKYRMWFRMSNRYNLVIVGVISKKSLKIVTSWNTDRKWQKTIQK